MAKTHDAILIRGEGKDIVELSNIACVEAKRKNHISEKVFLHPVWHIQSPYGHIVIVELPNGSEVGKALEVQGKKQEKT